MKRYVVSRKTPRAGEYIEYEPPASFTVHEPEPGSQDTGLVDRFGRSIYSVESLGPIGFIHPKEN